MGKQTVSIAIATVQCIANDFFCTALSMYSLGTLVVSHQEPTLTLAKMPDLVNSCTKDACVGRVWIYYSDASRVRSWGTINNVDVSVDTRNIICRQLGYDKSNDQDPRAPEELENPDQSMIWLTNFSACYHVDTTVYNNLLQCNPMVCNGCHDHTPDVIISCGKFLKCSKVGIQLVMHFG